MKPKHLIPLFVILVLAALIYQKILAGDCLTVVAVGDIMMGSTGLRGILPPNDGQDLFENIRPYLEGGDLVFGNLEGPLLDEGESNKCRQEKSPFCFEFKSPTRYGLLLKQAGFNALSLANNHTLDFGGEGIKSTLETLGSLGISPLGGQAIAEKEIKGKKVALVGFSFTPSPLSFSILEIDKAKEIISNLKKTHDLVIVSFHGGAEGKYALQVVNETEIFLNENRGNVRLFSRSVIDAGADLVLGHGPHVLRALELYKGKLIAYSLGNFLTYGMFNLKGPNGISGILKIKLDLENGSFLEGRLIPVKLVNGGIPEFDPTKEGIGLIKQLTENSRFNFNIQINEEGELNQNR
ncbi:MAG: capsule biosynthesis protein CapA [Desulfobacca sp.]|nr:capsule biosynthesis protein CapA [Desulfobacca sp.]